MYLLNEIKHDISMQSCQGSYIEMKKIIHMLEIDILGHFSQNVLDVLKGDF